MKWYSLAFCLAVFPVTICAQQADPQKLQQQQLTQQQQQLMQLQQQLAQQQQQLAQQQEQLKQQQEQLAQQQQQIARQQEQSRQNEILTKQLEHEKSANQGAAPGELKTWKADNPWYGTDYARTQFAMRYAKQLEQERPDLVGRPFLDAVSAKVRDTFGASR